MLGVEGKLGTEGTVGIIITEGMPVTEEQKEHWDSRNRGNTGN